MSDSGQPIFRPYAQLPHAFGTPAATGEIRCQPEEFQVDEVLGFEPDGEGEHLLLRIRKRNSNTGWVAGELARLAGVPMRDVSYAGLKDRNAVTSQWFCVRLAGKAEPDWHELESEELTLLQLGRHRRKLRRGTLRENRFQILVRNLQGDRDKLENRLAQIKQRGVPNFFGEQRFGHKENNLGMADLLFEGKLKKLNRNKRGLYLSAARSYLFNQLLAERVETGAWEQAMPGDLMMLDGSRAIFSPQEIDEEIQHRLEILDIHPTGPLFGDGASGVELEVLALEQRILENHPAWLEGLKRFGLKPERRALRSRIRELEWSWPAEDQLELRFGLAPGSYATTLLRELLEYQQ
jgi:tRNA pseudouridine13 synthase